MTRHSTAIVNAQADLVTSRLNDGYVRFFAGPIPAGADDPPPPGSKVLVELRFGKPAFDPARGGIAIARPLYSGEIEVSGNPTWFRTYEADGSAVVFDGIVGEDVILDDELRAGQALAMSVFSYRVPHTEEAPAVAA